MMGRVKPPSTNILKQLFKTPGQLGLAVVLYRGGGGLHIYDGSLGGEQIAGILHRGSGKDGCRGAVTISGLRWVGGGRGGRQRHFQLLRDFECWMSHCSVISMLSCSLQETE